MRVSRNICDYPVCKRKAVATYDVRPNGWMRTHETPLHYELCAKHDAEFFPHGEGWLNATQSERIKAELVPS